MTLIRITAPASDPVTLEETKEHIHVDHSDEDMRIADFIRTAAQRLDGRDGSLGRCLITQTWKLILDRFPAEITIPLPPCQSITSITYTDAAGTPQTLDPAEYQVIGLASADPARIRPAFGKSWPGYRSVPEGIAITFVAGFGDDPEDIPEPIRTAIKMHVGHLFEHRESVVLGTGFIAEVPDGAADLVRDQKVWSF